MSVVLVPGFMTDADLWTDIADALRSVGPATQADVTRDDTVEGMARRLLAEAPPVFVLIGFSMGGYVAREAARMAPERISALVLIATSARGDNHIQAQRKAAIADRGARLVFGGLSRNAILTALRPGSTDETAIDRVRAMGERLGGEVFRRQSLLVRHSDLGRLDQICCPTLVVAAAEDQLRTLEEAEELHAGIKDSIFQVIEGCGHMIPIEAPGALSEALTAWFSDIGPTTP